MGSCCLRLSEAFCEENVSCSGHDLSYTLSKDCWEGGIFPNSGFCRPHYWEGWYK